MNEGITRKKKDLRSKYVNNENFEGTEKAWVLETPYNIRDETMNDVLKAYQTNLAKGKDHKFQVKFKRKKQESDSIVILYKH